MFFSTLPFKKRTVAHYFSTYSNNGKLIKTTKQRKWNVNYVKINKYFNIFSNL